MENNYYRDDSLSPLLEENKLDLNECKQPEDIFEIIQTIMPNWILKKTTSYVNKYEKLQQNWFYICSQMKTTPKEIVIVDFIPDTPLNQNDGSIDTSSLHFKQFHILRHVIDYLTYHGYVIRSHRDITTCTKCGRAMLTEFSFNFFKERKNNLFQDEWSEVCEDCED